MTHMLNVLCMCIVPKCLSIDPAGIVLIVSSPISISLLALDVHPYFSCCSLLLVLYRTI